MDFLRSLVRNGAAGLGVKLGRFLDRLPDEFYAYADENDFPIVLLPSELRYSHAIRAAMEAILADEREDPSFGGILDDCLEEALFGDSPMRSLLRFEEAGFPLDTRVQVVLIAFRDAGAEMEVSAAKVKKRCSALFPGSLCQALVGFFRQLSKRKQRGSQTEQKTGKSEPRKCLWQSILPQ